MYFTAEYLNRHVCFSKIPAAASFFFIYTRYMFKTIFNYATAKKRVNVNTIHTKASVEKKKLCGLVLILS